MSPLSAPSSDQNPAGHRGNDDGMSVHGDQRNTGNPRLAVAYTRCRENGGARAWTVGPSGASKKTACSSG